MWYNPVMKKNIRFLILILFAAAVPLCAQGKRAPKKKALPAYVPVEEAEITETSTGTYTEDKAPAAGEPGAATPTDSGKSGPQEDEQAGAGFTQPPIPRASNMKRNPDFLYPERTVSIITHCGSPTKVPKKAPNGLDAIDLTKVTTVKGVPITDWPITSNISSVSLGNGQMCTPHSKSGAWPKLDFFGDKETKVEGNMWIFAYINGRWVGGAGHWLRPGQTCKGTNLGEVGPDIYYDAPPLKYWSPCHGELVGFAVSTPARAGQWGTAERSNVYLIKWP